MIKNAKRSINFFWLAMLAGFAFLLGAAWAVYGQDSAPLLPNGNFETGDRTGWNGYGSRIEIVSDDVHGGKFAGRVWLDQDWGGGLFSTFNAPKGKYRVSMWVKIAPSQAGSCWVGCDKFGGSKINLPIKEGGRWIPFEFEVKTRLPLGEIFAWGTKKPDGWILVDDVSITPI